MCSALLLSTPSLGIVDCHINKWSIFLKTNPNANKSIFFEGLNPSGTGLNENYMLCGEITGPTAQQEPWLLCNGGYTYCAMSFQHVIVQQHKERTVLCKYDFTLMDKAEFVLSAVLWRLRKWHASASIYIILCQLNRITKLGVVITCQIKEDF